jgi:hypothetical protein
MRLFLGRDCAALAGVPSRVNLQSGGRRGTNHAIDQSTTSDRHTNGFSLQALPIHRDLRGNLIRVGLALLFANVKTQPFIYFQF